MPLRAAPVSAGADTEAILEALGLDAKTRCRLRATGVI
jgi:crotonobetainyl-CoA:carnitine CoA-transferase CaiB-like acyl-CoA transferase